MRRSTQSSPSARTFLRVGCLLFSTARYSNGKNVIGFSGSFDRCVAAHHFFVTEISHVLAE
jgi:hypothetical protein